MTLLNKAMHTVFFIIKNLIGPILLMYYSELITHIDPISLLYPMGMRWHIGGVLHNMSVIMSNALT